MQIGKPEKYTVEDVVFLVSPKWGSRKVYRDAAAELPKIEDGNYHEFNSGAEKIGLGLLDHAILSIENLTDEGGEEVTEWTRELALDLPELLVNELIHRVVKNESDERLGNLPETLESSPETTSEGD